MPPSLLVEIALEKPACCALVVRFASGRTVRAVLDQGCVATLLEELGTTPTKETPLAAPRTPAGAEPDVMPENDGVPSL